VPLSTPLPDCQVRNISEMITISTSIVFDILFVVSDVFYYDKSFSSVGDNSVGKEISISFPHLLFWCGSQGLPLPLCWLQLLPEGYYSPKENPFGTLGPKGLGRRRLEGLSGSVSENLGDTTRTRAEGLSGKDCQVQSVKPTYFSSSPP